MRYTLGIDTASPHGSVALAEEGRAVAVERFLPREHSSGLSLAAQRLLGSRSLTLRDLTGLAVSEGPGSFTGLRIGLAWAKGLALGRGLSLALVPSHEAGAHGGREGSLWIATMIPSERGLVETVLWRGPAPDPIRGPERIEIEDAVSSLAEEVRPRAERGDRGSAPLALELRPTTTALEEALADDAADFGLMVRPPGPFAAAVAEIGDRRLASGTHADLVLAVPAYGREPNARKPGA